MHYIQIFVAPLLSFTAIQVAAQESVQAVHIFSRHGDRTAKSTPPTRLTELGYQEIYDSGQYFRNRYISSDASFRIAGLNADLVEQSQISVSAPADTVLQNSAQGFLQGLYPPVGPTRSTSTLRNGTKIQAPMDGYQLIPVNIVSHGQSSEDAAWLQGQSNCRGAQTSGQNFYDSAEYLSLLESTGPFYDTIAPMLYHILSPYQITYENAYLIYDALHVASIHNSTFPSSDRLEPSTLSRLRTLAHAHEYELAYNASDRIRAITGAVIAADVVSSLSKAVDSPETAPKLNIHFGAYAGMLSFFGLADLPSASADFFGIPEYASTLIWELVTSSDPNAGAAGTSVHKHHPRGLDEEELYVRFLFHNGTASNNISEPAVYPLFGQDRTLLPWHEFVEKMNAFAIPAGSKAWCQACDNSTGVCASLLNSDPSSPDGGTGAGAGDNVGNSQPLSTTQAGVIGAIVTLSAVLLIETVAAAVLGLRLVHKKRLQRTPSPAIARSRGSSPAPSFSKA